jgi:hypothetical protein
MVFEAFWDNYMCFLFIADIFIQILVERRDRLNCAYGNLVSFRLFFGLSFLDALRADEQLVVSARSRDL